MARYMKNAGTGCCAECRPLPCDSCAECCLYAWPDPHNAGGPFYPPSDPPPQVTFINSIGSSPIITVLNRIIPSPLPDLSDYFYGDDEYGTNIRVYAGEDGWVSDGPGVPGAPLGSSCLIYSDSSYPSAIADNFADTYLFTLTPTTSGIARTCTITRVSRCAWTGSVHLENGDYFDPDTPGYPEAGDYDVVVDYGAGREGNNYTWNSRVLGIPGVAISPDKLGSQDGPVGDYVIITVS